MSVTLTTTVLTRVAINPEYGKLENINSEKNLRPKNEISVSSKKNDINSEFNLENEIAENVLRNFILVRHICS